MEEKKEQTEAIEAEPTATEACASPTVAAPMTLAGFSPKGVQGGQASAIGTRHMILIDQIIAWSIAHPGQPWRMCAASLGVSPLFISKMINSDTFRERYQEVRDKTIEELGILPLKDKIAAAADMALERLTEKVLVAESVNDVKDATEMLLAQVYGAPSVRGASAPSANTTITVVQAIRDGRATIMGEATVLPPPV